MASPQLCLRNKTHTVMKRYHSLFVLLFIALVQVGCGDPEIPSPQDINDQLEPPPVLGAMEWKVETGRLVFRDEDHLNQGIEILEEKTLDELVEFQEDLGFRSLRAIDQIVSQAERIHLDSFFQVIPDSMDITWYDSMGIQYVPSETYQYYRDLGVIREEVDSLGGISYSLAIDQPQYATVLNESGEVMVNNEVWKFEPNGKLNSGKPGKALENGKTEEVTTNFDFTYHIHDLFGVPEIYQGGNYWILDPCKDQNKAWKNKRYRYRGKVTYSCTYNTVTKKTLHPRFKFEIEAQCRSGQYWGRNNGYRPFWGAYFTWKYRNFFRTSPNSNVMTIESTTAGLPVVQGTFTSPFSNTGLASNYMTKSLHPHGNYVIAAGSTWQFADNCQIHSGNFIFKFSGCGSGCEYPAH